MATHTLKEKMCRKAFPLHFLLGEGNKSHTLRLLRAIGKTKLHAWDAEERKTNPSHSICPFFVRSFSPSSFLSLLSLLSHVLKKVNGMRHGAYVATRGNPCGVLFFFFTLRVLGIKLRSSVLVASAFTSWNISLAISHIPIVSQTANTDGQSEE